MKTQDQGSTSPASSPLAQSPLERSFFRDGELGAYRGGPREFEDFDATARESRPSLSVYYPAAARRQRSALSLLAVLGTAGTFFVGVLLVTRSIDAVALRPALAERAADAKQPAASAAANELATPSSDSDAKSAEQGVAAPVAAAATGAGAAALNSAAINSAAAVDSPAGESAAVDSAAAVNGAAPVDSAAAVNGAASGESALREGAKPAGEQPVTEPPRPTPAPPAQRPSLKSGERVSRVDAPLVQDKGLADPPRAKSNAARPANAGTAGARPIGARPTGAAPVDARPLPGAGFGTESAAKKPPSASF